ncbi:glutathione synthase [Shewanella youngdeokensis]|uniref:glutathione synthase n=1 Tax=Shewanella youngdeokensis TaxID=2999068 RepID=A0ABZ0JTN7_9GAMM|nr:glutathione synthase [Shewanella sp. DAU334]
MKQSSPISQQIIDQVTEWAIMHGVAFRQPDSSAKHCPFSFAPMTMPREVFEHLIKVTPLLTQLISRVSEDHDFLQSALADVAQADPFFARLISLHRQAHGHALQRLTPARKPLLIMRTDFMDDRQHGAKVIEFNGIAAGMAPFGQRATELHAFIRAQWPSDHANWQADQQAKPAPNQGLAQLASAIATTAKTIAAQVKVSDADVQHQPTFLMVIQEGEANVYDQHLLEVALQKLGVRTVRRTFKQLSTELTTGANKRLMLANVGAIDVVYLRAGYQYVDYYSPMQQESVCCQTLSQTRLFIEQHHVAVNATFSQQLATSKIMQMILTTMPVQDFARWGFNFEQAQLIKSVLTEMKPINAETINWFNTHAAQHDWVLKNQGEGGGHCIFGQQISEKLQQLTPQEYSAWALMQRLYPHEREALTVAIRDSKQSIISGLVSEIGIFTAFFDDSPLTEMNGYTGYLIRSKPAQENEGGIYSGKGILDSLALTASDN